MAKVSMKMTDLECNFTYFRKYVFKISQVWNFQFKMLTFKMKNLNETVVDVRLLNRGHSGAKELSGYICSLHITIAILKYLQIT